MKTTPTNDLAALRHFVAECLTSAGFSEHEASLFLAGATILGHLRPSGCQLWAEHQTRQHLERLHPTDSTIERAGKIDLDATLTGKPYTVRPIQDNARATPIRSKRTLSRSSQSPEPSPESSPPFDPMAGDLTEWHG